MKDGSVCAADGSIEYRRASNNEMTRNGDLDGMAKDVLRGGCW